MTVIGVKEKPKSVASETPRGQSLFPSLCQIICSLSFRPKCCSKVQGRNQSNVVSALATVEILVGLVNIGLMPGRTMLHPNDFASLGIGYWVGGVLVAAGITSFFADGLPCAFSVVMAAAMNLIASIMAIFGIVFYAIDLGDDCIRSLCYYSSTASGDYEDCVRVAQLYKRLLTATDITMTVLVVLQLCISITLTVFCIKALFGRRGLADKDAELYQPVMVEVHAIEPQT